MSTSPPHPGTCPRCGTPIRSGFKFCPACAYRLLPTEIPPAEANPSNGRWLRALVFLTFGLFIVGTVLLGVVILRPAPTPVPTPQLGTSPRGLDAPLDVDDDLLREMVPLDLRPAARTLVTLGDGTQVAVEVRLPGYMRIFRYEVTRGMVAEYIRDCQAHPERIPEVLQRLFDPPPPPPPPAVALDFFAGLAHRGAVRGAEQAKRDADAYIAGWWDRLSEHVYATEGRLLRAPPDLKVPVPHAWRIRLLVPPSWVVADENESYNRWNMPEEEGRLPENYPVSDVSWYDAEAFAAWASDRLELPKSNRFRLPTWTEWMRAGHGGDLTFSYPWGKEAEIWACNNLNYWHGSTGRVFRPVDFRYPDGNFGQTREHLWAMSGNAREWTRNDRWFQVGGDLENGIPPEFERAEAVPNEIEYPAAPTMGGSFEEGIGDCTIGLESQQVRPKWRRSADVGFRLYLSGYGDYNPLMR